MAASNLIRWGGLAAMASAICAVISFVLYTTIVGDNLISEAAASPVFFLPSGAQLLAMVLLLVGLVALFARQTETFGALGLTGFLLALVGTTMAAGALWSQVFVVPRLAEAAPEVADRGSGSVLAGFLLSFLLFGVGWLLFGVATLRTRTFPRWAVILLIVGAIISILPLPSRALVLEIAVAWMGFTLLAERGARTNSLTHEPDESRAPAGTTRNATGV
jgi:membrane-bound ClpP family serine protease